MATYPVMQIPDRTGVSQVKLTGDQNRALEIVISWTVFHQPFFAHLLMSELKMVATTDVPIAATDGRNILINPLPFFEYTLPEQAFILCHEVLHCVFNDPILMWTWFKEKAVRVGPTDWPFISDLMNIAMDFVINAILVEGKVGTMPTGCCLDAKYSAKGHDAVVNVYEKLLKDSVVVTIYNRFDEVLQPGAAEGKEPDPAELKEAQSNMASAVASAALAADMQGKLPAALKRLIDQVLNPKVRWQDHIRATLNRVSGSEGLDWSQGDRRMLTRNVVGHERIFFARQSGFSCGQIIVGVDTSGSIDNVQITAFFREMYGIFEDMNPRELIIIDCDAKVYSVRVVEEMSELDDVRCQGVEGGGGTAFWPVFKRITEEGFEPDVLVYLTDLEGSFPEVPPSYPVIWGVIGKQRKAPFGEIVPVEL